jgi:hypothetical protein
VSPVKYELQSYNSEDGILHSHRREIQNLTFAGLERYVPRLNYNASEFFCKIYLRTPSVLVLSHHDTGGMRNEGAAVYSISSEHTAIDQYSGEPIYTNRAIVADLCRYRAFNSPDFLRSSNYQVSRAAHHTA